MRAITSVQAFGAAVVAMPASVNSASPASSTGRRPNRSDTGPYSNWPIARPIRYSVMVSWIVAGRDAESARRVGQRRDDQVHAQRAAGGDRHDQHEGRAVPSAVRRRSVPLHAEPFPVRADRWRCQARSDDASALPTTARERRWSLAAAIASVTVFGLSVGQSGPLLPLLLEQRGTDATLNGLNAGATFIGVIIGPLLAPRLVRRFGIRNFLLVCFGLDIALFLAMKLFDSIAAWFVLRAVLGVVGSSHLHDGRGVDQSARRRRGPRPRSSGSTRRRCRPGSAPGR